MTNNGKVLKQALDNLNKPTKFRRPKNQWQDPGEVTRIPSNAITMQGVSFPVYAQPDFGPGRMMYPGEDHYFPGASNVTEYPQMQMGGYKPTLRQISQMPETRYQPSDAVMNTKAGLAAASAVFGPFAFIPAIAGATYDLGTAAKYAMDGQWGNAAEDAMQAGVSLIPTAAVAFGLKGLAKASKINKAVRGVRTVKTASDLKDIGEAPGLTIYNKTTGRQQYFDAAGNEVSSISRGRTIRNPDYTDNGNSYLQNNNPWEPTTRSTLDDIPVYGGKTTKRPKYQIGGTLINDKQNNMYFQNGGDWGTYEHGGQMIRRADGSYSHRGLWDNIRANKGSGKKPTKQMLEQEKKIRAEEAKWGGIYANGGTNNPGFHALPDYVQHQILSNMAYGGDLDQMGKGGYVVTRSHDRKGKTHKVTGPDGTVKYFGDAKLGQHPNDPERKKAFYARHKKNLEHNPFFRAFARATWAEGGSTFSGNAFYQKGGVKLNPTQEYYANQMMKKYGKVVMTDKANNMTYYGGKNPDGSWNLNQFEVLTGANSNPQDQFISGYSLGEMEKMSPKDQKKQKVTPIGVFGLTPATIYGNPGYNVGNTAIAYHQTYEGPDDHSRRYLYDNGNAADNYRSYGCINCQKPSIEALRKFVGDNGTTAIIDSRLSAEENSKWMKQNTPSLGFAYEGPRSPMPGTKHAQVAAAKRTAPAPVAKPVPNKNIIAYNGPSVVDYMNAAGMDSSKESRARLAQQMGIANYDYSAGANMALLDALRQHNESLNQAAYGGQPCYSCGGSYAFGGYYDCDDQDKDPETGKCKAEVVRSRENAAANKAAAADMNAWAKQVAAMDRQNNKEAAAAYAGQLGFDYDWTGYPVDKAEKKAAMAAYKQFLQQSPNAFPADDTSGFSPEQKYILASKLKQKSSTNLGAKAFQDKFKQDPRFYDLQRIQSDIVPTVGGWSGLRDWMFNNKKDGGIHINPANKGKFTASANRAGMGVQEFASHVLANKDNYSSTMVKRANFAKNASNWHHQDGGPIVGDEIEVTPEELQMLQMGGYTYEII